MHTSISSSAVALPLDPQAAGKLERLQNIPRAPKYMSSPQPPDHLRTVTMPNLPPLPKIEGDVDLLLDVYTHDSLRFPGAPMNEDYGDTERLAELGAKALDLAVTFHMYSKKPFIGAQEIAAKRDAAVTDENIELWLDSYGLKAKLRYAPGDQDKVNSPQAMRKYFNTYVGALYIRSGIATIQAWISPLIDPDADVPMPEATPPPAPPSYSQQPSWQTAPQPAAPPPPLPSFPPSSPGNGGVSSLVSLALVNQTAVQRGFQVTYPAEQVGPPHQPTWTVRCCLNGQERGRGIGKSQKIAKEEAARGAWVTMGWGPHA